ncbi:MAG: tat (twin-arginine translocation) pathway signal sequence, partial [Burkholderiales bacterium]|nr:tat (twin-arginine translocation) pathway signal sequence [Burkholderiales bacterium]
DAKASTDAAVATQLRAGVAALDRAAGGSYTKAGDKKKLEIVKAMEGQPFFATVRGQCITSLYDNDMAFAVFGYPGSAWEKGGYITRGFQDLKWLPAPPLAASPKPYFG